MPEHSKLRFDFLSLWNETETIYHQNRTDPRLVFAAGHHSLTEQACKDLAGSGPSSYDGSTIWTRATTWKIPLIQVFALFPRPPLNLATECFVMVHLLGDPIDTVQNLLLKISLCQKGVNKWKECLRDFDLPIVIPNDPSMDGLAVSRARQQIEECRWKSLALVTDAYDEWGQAEQQVDVMRLVCYMSMIRHF